MAVPQALAGMDALWLGWSGDVARDPGRIATVRRQGELNIATIDLAPHDVRDYYEGYANSVLWPLFHERPDLVTLDQAFAAGYARVNARMADAATPLIGPDDIVWIHDYHLLPLGAELRRRGCANRIGFFLHIPWPAAALLATLSDAEALVRGLFACDLVGFQTDDSAARFRAFATARLGARAQADGLRLGDRFTRLLTCPVGIDARATAAAATGRPATRAARRLRTVAAGRTTVLGVDRLDYTKGIDARLRGYERYLQTHEDERADIFMLQLSPPSRPTLAPYRALAADLDRLARRICADRADLSRPPLRHLARGTSRDVLAGLYRAADIGLVTPLRDGMNLIAKEYVAAQDPADPGVLILSATAGAAKQLGGALLVDAADPVAIAAAIARAKAMHRDERVDRWTLSMRNVAHEDVAWWRTRFLDALTDVPARVHAPVAPRRHAAA